MSGWLLVLHLSKLLSTVGEVRRLLRDELSKICVETSESESISTYRSSFWVSSISAIVCVNICDRLLVLKQLVSTRVCTSLWLFKRLVWFSIEVLEIEVKLILLLKVKSFLKFLRAFFSGVKYRQFLLPSLFLGKHRSKTLFLRADAGEGSEDLITSVPGKSLREIDNVIRLLSFLYPLSEFHIKFYGEIWTFEGENWTLQNHLLWESSKASRSLQFASSYFVHFPHECSYPRVCHLGL